MKLTPTAALAALCWTARLASAATGYVYMSDASHTPQGESKLRALNLTPARLVLAQRAGVEDYHSADLESAEVIEAINAFGVRTPLFGEQDKRPKAMVLVEGAPDDEAAISSLNGHPFAFAVDRAPSATADRGLWIDLAKQAQPSTYTQLSDAEALERMSSYADQLANGDIFYIASSTSELHSLLADPKISGKYAITAYLAPYTEAASKDDSTWGTYTMPNTQSPLHKRSTQGQPQKEAPLEYTKTPSASDFEAAEAAKTIFESFSAPISANVASNSTPLAGILPSCFTSQAACERQTRNCTGHGTCFKKFTDHSAKDQSRYKDCWSCGCAATTQKNSEGKVKTTYWGGPACQKRDVSVQFWLIALFTVGLVFVVMFAVGSVMEMGGQELPSVIGAGVSGPVKR